MAYSFRLSSLVVGFSLLATTLTQTIDKAKTWRDEDRQAKALVRNYDGLGNYVDPNAPRSRWEHRWPDEDGFELWDWVGNVGGRAAAGSILMVGLGLKRE